MTDIQEDNKIQFEFHNTLNPRLFRLDNHLRPELKWKLIQFAQVWANFAGIPKSAIKDIILTGSQAGYSYTQYSDINISLAVDVGALARMKRDAHLETSMRARKTMWILTHKTKILGYPVEPFAHNHNSKFPNGQGVYSLQKDKWIQKPTLRSGINFRMDPVLKARIEFWMHLIDDVVDQKMDYATAEFTTQRINMMRQAGLQRAGERSQENQIYLQLRQQGYVERLQKYQSKFVNKSSSSIKR